VEQKSQHKIATSGVRKVRLAGRKKRRQYVAQDIVARAPSAAKRS